MDAAARVSAHGVVYVASDVLLDRPLSAAARLANSVMNLKGYQWYSVVVAVKVRKWKDTLNAA